MRGYFLSPALPAAGLLFGMVFCLAISFFVGLPWSQLATIAFYGVLLVWIGLLVMQQREAVRDFGLIDKLFYAFVLVALMSLAANDIHDIVVQKYLKFLPFMVLVPFLCGRLMRPRDIRIFAVFLAWAGPAILILALVDYWVNLADIKIYSRWRFFGHDHTPLLIGFVLSGSMVALAFHFFTAKAIRSGSLMLYQLAILTGLGVQIMAIVLIAARGALLGGLLGVACLTLTMRGTPIARRVFFLGYVTVMVALVSFALPKPQMQFYARLMTSPDRVLIASNAKSGSIGLVGPEQTVKAIPILGQASCKPFEVGTNSVAMRWVLYQEAIAVFMNWPWIGAGAALFGRNSCSGVSGFPHSTILQSFSELGIVGGLLYIGLVATGGAVIIRRLLHNSALQESHVASLCLALLTFYLFTDQVYGNYFMAVGTYFLIGVSASTQSNHSWNKSLEAGDA